MKQPTLFDSSRTTLDDAIELTAQSLRAHGDKYRHWAIAFSGWLAKRLNAAGQETWGAENKHAVGTATGIPVDFFLTAHKHWFNTLVCKTGSAENNIRIAAAAQARGWKWNPTGSGFSRQRGDGTTEFEHIESEEHVFAWLGWPYKRPEERNA